MDTLSRHSCAPVGTVFTSMKGEPDAQWFALCAALQYFDTMGGLVIRDTSHGGMAKSLVIQSDFDTPHVPRRVQMLQRYTLRSASNQAALRSGDHNIHNTPNNKHCAAAR